jgi:hypothetical protein
MVPVLVVAEPVAPSEPEAQAELVEIVSSEEDEEDDCVMWVDTVDYDSDIMLTGRAGLAAVLAWNVHQTDSFDDHRAWSYHGLGAELALRVARGVEVLGGVQLLTTHQRLPPELQLETGLYATWLTIHPVNLGFRIKPRHDEWQPYLGADAILTRYQVDPSTQGLALGGRLRAGADTMLSEHFGVNLDLALGGWSNVPTGWTDRRMRNGGLLPQLSLGVLIAD